MNFHPLLQKQIERQMPQHLLYNKEVEAFLYVISHSYHTLENNNGQAQPAFAGNEEDDYCNKMRQNQKPKNLVKIPLESIDSNGWNQDYEKDEISYQSYNEQLFHSIAENMPGLLFKYHHCRDKSGFFSYLSPNVEKKIGITAEQLHNFYGILHPDDITREKKTRKKAIEHNLHYYFEGRFVIPYKPIIWLRIVSSSIVVVDEKSLVYTGFITNITKEKEAELALQLHEEKYRSIIANMNLGMTEIDNDDVIRYVNQSFCDMCGYSHEELMGQKAAHLFLNDDTLPMMNEKIKLRKEGYCDVYELAVKHKNGKPKWWLISGAPHFNNSGEVVGTIGIHLDITEQKKLQSDLILARKEAEESARSKQVFLANMSHEIRTPMNAIIGMSHQLAKTQLSEQQRMFLEIIHTAADNLLVVVNDVLDVSKMNAGKLTIETIGFYLKDVIDRAIHVVEHKAEEKGLQIGIEYYDAKIAPVQLGDPYRINQILLNLLSNAVKFTNKGSVSLRCFVQSETADSQKITIEVRDTGIGMEAEFVNRIFDAFYQEYSSTTRKYGGTGLGMHICKQLIEMMGGTIEVKSKKKVGTAVTITLDCAIGKVDDIQRNEIMPYEAKLLNGRKILVADDNDMNRLLITVVFKNYDTHVLEAKNGKEAVDLLRHEAVDAVLMDIQMPVMDGVQATKIIREELKSNVPIIALTANAVKSDHEKYLACGMNSYVLKPFHEDDLIKAIIKELDKKQMNDKKIVQKQTLAKEEDTLYNLTQLIEISRGDNNFVSKMIGIFVHQAQLFMDEAKEEINNNNIEKVAPLAHKFKPSVGNLCQPFLFDDIKQLEQLALAGNASEEFITISNQFLNHINNVVLQLKERF